MIKSISVTALAGLAALAVSAGALAAGPALAVWPTTSDLSAATTAIVRFEDSGEDPVSSIDVFAPRGYSVSLDQPFGTTFGTLDAHVTTPTAPDLRATGQVRSADPSSFTGSAALCTPERTNHDAVWTANLNAHGAVIGRLILFVDGPARSQRAAFSARVRACLEDPVASGFRLIRAALTLNGVFTNPSTRGDYRWTTIMRTFSELSAPPLQSQTIVGLPPKLTLRARVIRPHGQRGRAFVRLSGAVRTNGRGASGLRVALLGGTRPGELKRLTYATSFERGAYELVAPLKGNSIFRAQISAPLRAGPLSRCETIISQPDAICSNLTFAPFTAQSASVRLG